MSKQCGVHICLNSRLPKADTQVIGMNKRKAADDDNDDEILMITVGKLGHWSSRGKVIDNNRKSTEN